MEGWFDACGTGGSGGYHGKTTVGELIRKLKNFSKHAEVSISDSNNGRTYTGTFIVQECDGYVDIEVTPFNEVHAQEEDLQIEGHKTLRIGYDK